MDNSENLSRPFLLEPCVKNYAWGKLGATSLVARLAGTFDRGLPYAELWFGGHPDGSAMAIGAWGRTSLAGLIAQYPEALLGASVLTRFGSELPFLLKVLSIQQALSLQLHPDRESAERLFEQQPQYYPDPRHKPEVAIGVSEVSLLCDLRSRAEIRSLLERSPELVSLIQKGSLNKFGKNSSAHELLGWLMGLDYAAISGQVEMVIAEGVANITDRNSQVLCDLVDQYGAVDPGVIASLLLNVVDLRPGEGIFIQPNAPHAYLSGDLVECMANSNNIVRGGLTAKYRDIDTFVQLQSKSSHAGSGRIDSTLLAAGHRRLSAPVDEFVIEQLFLPGEYIFQSSPHSPCIAVIMSGEITVVRQATGDQGNSRSSRDEPLRVAAGQGVFLAPTASNFSQQEIRFTLQVNSNVWICKAGL